MNNEHEIIEEQAEEIPFRDKRRVNDEGERIDIEVGDGSEVAEVVEPVKSPEVVKLENALEEITNRCEAAETKLQSVQVRFEEEKAKLEQETSERRERMKKSLEQRADQGRVSFLNTLLPVIDNLNLAITASEKDSSFEHLLDGVKGTARSFEQALANVGVERTPTIGEKFNPEFHEAVEMVDVEEEEKNGMIVGEFASGFTFKGKLLRPARVQVGNLVKKQEAGE
ncbi:MAG: nucleotide exchange factor GrpE [Pyrinomonadaceae bacterium]|nr:nucleotide exchange factor GrpE [Pyrinomonadaceae bacterium]